jgi:hypothetical protein
VGALCVDDARVGLQERREPVRDAQREAALGLGSPEDPILDPTGSEGLLRALGEVAHELDQADERNELATALGFELAPADERLLGQSNPIGLWVREAEDAGGAVTRPSVVSELELLQDDDVSAFVPEGMRGR